MNFSVIKKVLASFAIVAAILLPAINTKAGDENGPKFNFMENDVKTLRGANRTAGDVDWQSSVSGEAGDEFRGMVYIHNGFIDTTAKNTRVSVSVPSETVNGKAIITATISADNAASVTDTLEVTLDEDSELEPIFGVTSWFPTVDGSAMNEFDFPNGQSGDEIFGNGVNVGDVKGCWNFVQYISFGFRSFHNEFANIAVDKSVRNVTTNETSFVQSNQANIGDVLEYKIDVENTGDADAEKFVLVDTLPAGTSFIPGSVVVLRDGNNDCDDIDHVADDNGMVINHMKAGEVVTIKFRVKITSKVSEGTCLVNDVKAFFDKTEDEATAQTCINKHVTPVNPPVGPALPVSGASTDIAAGLMTLLAGYVVYAVKVGKIRKTAEFAIAKDLLSK